MSKLITKRFLETALFGVIGVTAACGAAASGHLLQAHPDSEHTSTRMALLLGLATTAGGSLMCAAGAATDAD